MHVEFVKDEAVPLRDIEEIAETSRVQVHAVACGRIRLCRKTQRVHRRFTAAEALQEVRHMQGLRHSHVVTLIGSYFQDSFLSILTYPVADMDLKQFMKDLPRTADRYGLQLRALRAGMTSFFPCISAATTFIHQSKIKHMDIKPANILLRYRPSSHLFQAFQLFMTDFGISRTILDPENSQTDGRTGHTEMYCSPEVASNEPRGRSSDIFSLGCVFSEILTCICGEAVRTFQHYRTDDGESFHRNLALVVQWIDTLPEPEDIFQNLWWFGRTTQSKAKILNMLDRDPMKRPTAFSLLWTWPELECCRRGPVELERVRSEVPREAMVSISTPLPPVPAVTRQA
jgi:serine/threonine protein kinase